MTGAILIGFFILAAICLIISYFVTYGDEEWRIGALVCAIIGAIFLIAIPMNRISTKSRVVYARVLQETLDANRENEQQFSVLERTSIIEEINGCNNVISKWQTKGDNWYNNKWYYHPTTKEAKYLK